MKAKWGKLLKSGKAMYLAYDQGMEHGPIEFDGENCDPLFIIDIAKKGKYNGLIVQKGIAEKYNKEIKKSKVPLIIKLNGKTNLEEGEPVSRQLCSLDEALKLGAKAVGYTIYLGSEHESIMLAEFDKIEEEADKKGIPVIAWIYPRGKGTIGKSDNELMEYAARVGLEIDADMVKLKYSGDIKSLKKSIKDAGRCKLIVAGGMKTNEQDFLKECKEAMKAGTTGMAVGRNIWKSDNPIELSKKLRKIIFID